MVGRQSPVCEAEKLALQRTQWELMGHSMQLESVQGKQDSDWRLRRGSNLVESELLWTAVAGDAEAVDAMEMSQRRNALLARELLEGLVQWHMIFGDELLRVGGRESEPGRAASAGSGVRQAVVAMLGDE